MSEARAIKVAPARSPSRCELVASPMAAAQDAYQPLLGPRAPSASGRSPGRFVLPTGVRRSASCILAEGAAAPGNGGNSAVQRRLAAALVLCAVFLVVEVVGGVMAHSLAILTDAAHLLSDVGGFAVALFAGWYAARKGGATHTFGYHRVEVLGALASVLITWLVTGVLVYEAIDRIMNPVTVNGRLMFFIALAGIAVNAVNFAVLGHHHHGPGGGGCSHGHDHGGSPRAAASKNGHGHGHSHSGHAHGHGHSSSATGLSNGAARGHAHDHAHGQSGVQPLRPSEAAGGAGAKRGALRRSHSHDVEAACHTHDHSGHGGCGHDGEHAHAEQADMAEEMAASINLRGAVLHVIGDLVQSIGVAIAGALIWWKQDDPRWQLADPLCTFFFALLVLATTVAIMRDISDILMERVPRSVCLTTLAGELAQIEGVDEVHDLHVWALKPGMPLLAAHINIGQAADAQAVLGAATAACRSAGIDHTTIQMAAGGAACPCYRVEVSDSAGPAGPAGLPAGWVSGPAAAAGPAPLAPAPLASSSGAAPHGDGAGGAGVTMRGQTAHSAALGHLHGGCGRGAGEEDESAQHGHSHGSQGGCSHSHGGHDGDHQ